MQRAVLAAAICAALTGCGGGSDCLAGKSVFGVPNCAAASSGGGAVAGPVVLYEVSGTARKVALTYTNRDGGTEQQDVALPWSTRFSGVDRRFLYLSAQNAEASGSVVVTISIDGIQKKTATSSGAFVIATVDATCC